MLYVLPIATLVLGFMLLKVCRNSGNNRQQRMQRLRQEFAEFHKPQISTNKGVNISEIRHQIELHKTEIRKLEELAKQAE
jgi:hypothetical protein